MATPSDASDGRGTELVPLIDASGNVVVRSDAGSDAGGRPVEASFDLLNAELWDVCYVWPTSFSNPHEILPAREIQKNVQKILLHRDPDTDQLSGFYELDIDDLQDMTVKDYSDFLYHLFGRVLLKLGCNVKPCTPVEGGASDIYLRVRLPDEFAKDVADRYEYPLQVDRHAKSFRYPDEETYVPPYLAFEQEAEESPGFAGMHRYPYRIWARYDALSREVRKEEIDITSSDVTIFRQVDRMRLYTRLINEYINVPFLLMQKNCRSQIYLHQKSVVHDLKATWGRLQNIWSLEQPVDKIRNYFGEEIAFYFAWLGFYTKLLRFPAVLGFGVVVLSFAMDEDMKMVSAWENVAAMCFCVYMFVWSNVFLEMWNRREVRHRLHWGMEGFKGIATERPEFQEDSYSQSEVNPRVRVKHFSEWKFRLRQIFSGSVTGTFIVVVVICVVGIFTFRLYIKTHATYFGWVADHGAQVVALANSIQIKIFDLIWTRVAKMLTDSENHRYQAQYDDSLIVKMFLFKFLNQFNTFFYIAFFKESIDPCAPEGLHTCMVQLRTQLTYIFLVLLFTGLLEVLLPLFNYWWRVRSEKDKRMMTRAEQQFRQDQYKGTLEDYMELVLQFGFVTLFPVALPVVPLLALISNHFEIRTDALKMLVCFQRPYPFGAQGIGAWKGILNCITYLSVSVNVALAVFSLKISSELPLLYKVVIFILAEHVVFMLKYVVMWAIPDVPRHVRVAKERMTLVEKELIWGAEDERNLTARPLSDEDVREMMRPHGKPDDY